MVSQPDVCTKRLTDFDANKFMEKKKRNERQQDCRLIYVVQRELSEAGVVVVMRLAYVWHQRQYQESKVVEVKMLLAGDWTVLLC